jgi:hypothetical protein
MKACPRVLIRWRADATEREACVAERYAARLRREAAACKRESLTGGSDCTGYDDAATALEQFSRQLRGREPSSAAIEPAAGRCRAA